MPAGPPLPARPPHPPVTGTGGHRRARRRPVNPWQRRAAVAVAVVASGLTGFTAGLLLAGEDPARAAQKTAPDTSSEEPSGDVDPDGAGTLREGDTGPEVTELQERLRRVPDVYVNGSTAGTYDAALTAAVARFQQWYGIRGDETGVYGDDTRRDLESRTADP
ncbi:peptidoglycan-binding protein [Streptomyces sp. NPDC059785]|uniref:peptidoglycan-binding protein n=1 Tax=unclassified Streptomyces TaxID=2593676 RepID=UPI003651B70C